MRWDGAKSSIMLNEDCSLGPDCSVDSQMCCSAADQLAAITFKRTAGCKAAGRQTEVILTEQIWFYLEKRGFSHRNILGNIQRLCHIGKKKSQETR